MQIRKRQRRRESTANNSNSSEVLFRESCLATAQIKPVNFPRHAEVLCLLYFSDGVVSLSLSLHLAPGVRRCSAIALRLGGALVSFGLPPSRFVVNNETSQQASAQSCSGWDRGHLLCP
jgi:hypothetical protein